MISLCRRRGLLKKMLLMLQPVPNLQLQHLLPMPLVPPLLQQVNDCQLSNVLMLFLRLL